MRKAAKAWHPQATPQGGNSSGDENGARRYLYQALRLSHRRRFHAEEAETRGALGDLEKSR